MTKHLTYILIIFGLLLTACNNDTETVDESIDETADENTETSSDNESINSDESDTSNETSTGNNSVTEDGNDSHAETEDDTSDQPTSEEGGRYSSDDAVRLVKEYLEAEGLYMEMNYLFDGTDDNGHYRIQVFEVVDNGEGNTHTATYGWYLIDPETGAITDLFN